MRQENGVREDQRGREGIKGKEKFIKVWERRGLEVKEGERWGEKSGQGSVGRQRESSLPLSSICPSLLNTNVA